MIKSAKLNNQVITQPAGGPLLIGCWSYFAIMYINFALCNFAQDNQLIAPTPQEGHFLSVPQQPITASSSAETLTDNTITAPGTPTLQPTTPTIPPYQKEIRFGDKTNRSQNRFILPGLGSVQTHQIPTSSLR